MSWWVFILLITPIEYLASMVLDDTSAAGDWAKLLALIACIFLAWMELAVGAKRYHDMGKSGWRQALGLIPIIGSIWVFIELGFVRGTPGPNRFGYPGELPVDD